ncbi:MAG TPA: DciA family protein [bacterium]|nr:DciA family protein [bacterium]
MKRVSEVLSSERNSLLKILINWTEICGISNRELMIPVEIKDSSLVIAVPNGMVAKSFARFKHQILINLDKVLKKHSVSDIKFTVDPARFREKQPSPSNDTVAIPEISPEELLAKKLEIESRGISPALSGSMAKIELLWQKKEKRPKNAV